MQFNQNMEVFRAIDGYVNYEVSNHGRIRNAETGRILKPKLTNSGYLALQLWNNGKGKDFFVHRLVADAFLENPHNYETVDHIDRVKDNNHYQNLRWANMQQQNRNRSKLKSNSSGFPGIDYIKSSASWRARIIDNNGKRISKYFSVNKHPDALEKCVEWRRQKEIEYNYNQ